VRERLRGYADAVLETSAPDIATVAGQLQGFSDLLNSSVDLHWAMASPATPVQTKRVILEQLLAKKVSGPVLDLLTFTLQNVVGEEFDEDVAALAVAAVARRDGMVLLDEGPLGRLGATDRIEGYATAVLAPVHGERALGDIEDELFRFMRIVEGNDELRVALTTGELSADVRARITSQLLEGRGRPESARMASYANRVGRPRDFPVLLDALVQLVAKETNRRMADVRSAVELSAKQRASLRAALTKFTGYPVDVRVTPEPGLLGGFVATIGDLVIDTSVRHRLEQARELLLHPPAPATPRPAAEETGPGQVGPAQTGPGQTGPDRARPGSADLGQAGPGTAATGRAGPDGAARDKKDAQGESEKKGNKERLL
jgi:F-type H+-transporting ATPase subunit delta